MKPNLLEEPCFRVSEEAAERCSSKLTCCRNRDHRVRCVALTIVYESGCCSSLEGVAIRDAQFRVIEWSAHLLDTWVGQFKHELKDVTLIKRRHETD